MQNKAMGLQISLNELQANLPVIEQIKLQARQYGVDESLALNIACAESRFVETAQNPNSSAGGVYQYLDGTWKHYALKYWGSTDGRDKLKAADNIELTMLVLRDVGTSDWNASKSVWSTKAFERGACKAL